MAHAPCPPAGRAALAPVSTAGEAEVVLLVSHHARLRALCAALEACADRLPAREAVRHGARLSAALAVALRRHDGMDAALFGVPMPPAPLLGRLRACLAIDQLHAEDLSEALASAATSPAPIGADMLSYMMRALFDGCRRSIDFRETTLLLLGGPQLGEAARWQLCVSLASA